MCATRQKINKHNNTLPLCISSVMTLDTSKSMRQGKFPAFKLERLQSAGEAALSDSQGPVGLLIQ